MTGSRSPAERVNTLLNEETCG